MSYITNKPDWKTRVEDSWIQFSNTLIWLAGNLELRLAEGACHLQQFGAQSWIFKFRLLMSGSSNHFDTPKQTETWVSGFSETSNGWRRLRHFENLQTRSFWELNLLSVWTTVPVNLYNLQCSMIIFNSKNSVANVKFSWIKYQSIIIYQSVRLSSSIWPVRRLTGVALWEFDRT